MCGITIPYANFCENICHRVFNSASMSTQPAVSWEAVAVPAREAVTHKC